MIGLGTVTSGAPVVGAILVPLAIHVAVRLKRCQDAVLVLGLLVVPLLTIAVLATTTRGRLDPVSDPWGATEGEATEGYSIRKNDSFAIEAYFSRESYRPGTTAQLHFETILRAVRLQLFHVGPEWSKTAGNMQMRGVAATESVLLGRIVAGSTARVTIGDWPTGLYFAQLTAPGGRIGYAPFVVPPKRLGQNRVAVVLPTRTWQAYNFRDDDSDGKGDTWYATPGRFTARLHRPFLNRGVPPHFRSYDLHFLHWLSRSGKRVDILSQAEIDTIRDPAALRRAYNLLIFPGHHEYVTAAEYDAVEGFRDRGGSLVFLSANNFFWRIDLDHGLMTRVAKWRELGRPEASLLGVQFVKNDMGEHRGPWLVRKARATNRLFSGTGSEAGEAFSNGGIEIDHTAPRSPVETQVIAEIPNVLGPGLTAQMTYYATPRGAKSRLEPSRSPGRSGRSPSHNSSRTSGPGSPVPRRGLSRPRPRTDATRRPTVSEARSYRMTQSEADTE